MTPNTIRFRPKSRRNPPPKTAGDDPIDLERVIWDPEYRAKVRDRLNRNGPGRPRRPTRKAG